MIVAPGRAVRTARVAVAVAAVAGVGLVGGGCGGDDDPEPDPEAFCELGPAAVPVEDASPDDLATLADVAPADLRDDLEVLRAAAERLADFEDGDPAALEAEFEIRFDPEYATARDAVEAAVARCPRPGSTAVGGDADDPIPTTEEDTP